MTISEQVSRSLYRAVLRFARHSNGVPFSLSSAEARAAVPLLLERESRTDGDGGNKNLALLLLRRRLDSALEEHSSSSSWDSSSLVRKVARIATEAGKETKMTENKKNKEEALDAAFRALRSLNGEHWRSQITSARASRAEHSRRGASSPPSPKYKIGQVFVHKKFGYRAVIIGWDRSCAKGPAWAKAVGASTAAQPFYSCLPDSGDCASLFGAARSSKYVAEENVVTDAAELPEGGLRVTHPLLRSFFDAWRERGEEEEGGGGEEKEGGRGRYIGNARLRYEFPDDFDDFDEDDKKRSSVSAVEDDSNLLLSDGEREARRRSGRGGRTRSSEGGDEKAAASPASSASSVESAAEGAER